MLASRLNLYLALSLVVLLLGVGRGVVQELALDRGALEPARVVQFEASDEPARPEGTVVVDVALVARDHASTGEVLLAAAAVEVRPGQDFDLDLSYVSPDFEGSLYAGDLDAEVRRLGGSLPVARASGNESFELPATMEPRSAKVIVRGRSVFGATGGVSLTDFESVGMTLFPRRSERLLAPLGNLAWREGDVAVAFGNVPGELVLLVGLSGPDGPGVPSNRLQSWQARAQAALKLAPLTSDAMESCVPEKERVGSALGTSGGYLLVDPGIELAKLGLALADRPLLDAARVALGDKDAVTARFLAAVPWHWDSRVKLLPRAPHNSRGGADAVVAAAVAGAVDWDATGDLGGAWGRLTLGFDPVRLIAVDPAPAILEEVLAFEREEPLYRNRDQHLVAAVTGDFGTTPEARAAWHELKNTWLQRAGLQARIAAGGLGLVGLLWLLEFLGAWLVCRFPGKHPRFRAPGIGGLSLALFVSLISIGSFELKVLVFPYFLALGRHYLGSGKRSFEQRLSVFLMAGFGLASAVVSLGLLPTLPVFEPVRSLDFLFLTVFLAYVFVETPERWKLGIYDVYLMAGLASSLVLALLGTQERLPMPVKWTLMVVTLGLQVAFLFGSWRLQSAGALRSQLS